MVKTESSLDTLENDWNYSVPISSENALENLKKRAQSKYYGRKFVLRLIDIESALQKRYWDTFYCNEALEQEGKKLFAHYCGNRWCLICNRIRTAKLINGYKPQIDQFKEPIYMVLTVKNVPAAILNLRYKIIEMNKKFRQIVDLIRKRDGLYVEGVRTIEVTYNQKTKEFHPHFNLVCNTKIIATLIQTEWLKHFDDVQVNIKGQFMSSASSGTYNELFKYVTKFDAHTNPFILDIIYQALQGIKITAPTGIKKVKEDVEELISTEFSELPEKTQYWCWNNDRQTWVTKHCFPDPEGVSILQYIHELIKNKSP